MREYPYRVNAKLMSRSKGHHAVAAAAYRAGEDLREDMAPANDASAAQIKPLIHSYSRRHGVMSNFIVTPKNAPAWTQSREKLWNKVEAGEKRVDAQVAREVVVMLPDVELFDYLDEDKKLLALKEFYEEILRKYVKENFVNEGMIADVALHEPAEKNDERNFHAHIMLTMRPLDPTSETGFGLKNRSWNQTKKLEKWRENCSLLLNDTLKKHGIEGFVTHESFEARGLDITPTKPLGAHNYKKERKGIATEVGNDNRKAKEENKEKNKYLERAFERSPMARRDDILSVMKREGIENVQDAFDELVANNVVSPLYSKETGEKTGMFSLTSMQSRLREMKEEGRKVHQRSGFALPESVVDKAVQARGDKLVRKALAYTAGNKGFKVVEAANNGHKKTYLKACHDMYRDAGYDVVSVARNNTGKDAFKNAGITKSVITYTDLLRRYGERYTGEKSTSQKVIIIDDADKLSPLQDRKIFEAANKIGAKLIYVGSLEGRKQRMWQSQFDYYKTLTTSQTLRHKFQKAKTKRVDTIRDAFMNARTYDALKMQKAKYVHACEGQQQAKQGVLNHWYKGIKKRDDKRFILCGSQRDAINFNNAIQKERVARKHLQDKNSKHFTAQYKMQGNQSVKRELCLYWGDMIQFKRNYKDLGIEEGTRARVLVHIGDESTIETDDGRLLRVKLGDYNSFDLGYAADLSSHTEHTLDQAYVYHSKDAPLDDAPKLYQRTNRPPHVFYDEKSVGGLKDLANQMLGRGHELSQGFSDTLTFDGRVEQPEAHHREL